jgi:hypothetical protein
VKSLALLALLAGLALALNPERSACYEDATLYWRENHCEGFGPGDCSVREPRTANVRVEFPGRTVRLLVRCKAAKCVADPDEIAEWVKRAKDSK